MGLLLHGRGDNQHRPLKLKAFEGELMEVKLEVAEMVKVRSGFPGAVAVACPFGGVTEHFLQLDVHMIRQLGESRNWSQAASSLTMVSGINCSSSQPATHIGNVMRNLHHSQL